MPSLKRNMPWATLDRPSSKATAAAKKGWGQWMFSELPDGFYREFIWILLGIYGILVVIYGICVGIYGILLDLNGMLMGF